MMLFRIYISGGLAAVYMLRTQPSAVPSRHRLLQCLIISVHSPYLATLPGLFKQTNKLNNNPYKLLTDHRIHRLNILKGKNLL